jgi:ATP-dependent helicase HrpB
MNDRHALPVEEALPALRAALAERGAAVLQAPPGAGKTTRVPLALLSETWLGAGRILMLEPRRLAARAAAFRMAETMDDEPGGLVGYRVRHDTRVGPRTRVEVLTEGVLTRMLQAHPDLDGVGLVIFDEFHERSVHADLGLALTLQSKAILRPELRILVMSATLDGGAVAALLDQAPIITSEGREHPVATRYLPPRSDIRLERAVAAAVRTALAEEEGDVLAFLPGAGEIRRTAALLDDVAADVIPLHGMLGPGLQQQALRPSSPGRRKVVLASAIAETSLTIDGVRVVVDGGWSRVPRYSARTGMTRLATVRVTRAAADQRRGRAGRQAPGTCYRLWSAAEEAMLVPRPTPEILETDLAPLALDLAAAGVADPGDLQWLDPPPEAGLTAARTLLTQLGALDVAGRITAHGRRMTRLSLHPRLAHMVIHGRALGVDDVACDLAALLSERGLLARASGQQNADITLRLELLRGRTDRADVDRESLRRARAEANACRDGRSTQRRQPGAPISPGLLLAMAYPDRIARRRPGPGGRFVLRSGAGAVLEDQALAREEFLVAADLDGQPPDSRIRLAAALDLTDLESHFGAEMVWEDDLRWDDGARSVVARRRRRLGAIVLEDHPLAQPNPADVTNAMLEGIRKEGVDRLPWSDAARRLRARLAFVHYLQPDWPDQSDEGLARELATWLGPSLHGLRRWQDLERLDLGALLLARLPWDQRAALESWAPAEIVVPSGSRIPVDYSDPAAPVLAVRLQELFGLAQTPRVGRDQVPMTLHLLSPARRPVQVTRDLAGFWRTTYFEVRKDLRGRYPKHHWPDDPLVAEPTRRAKRRGSGGT